MKGNVDVFCMRIHLYQHYRDEFEAELREHIIPDSLELFCDLCPKKKKFQALTHNGVVGTLLCHRAIFHQKLKDKSMLDSEITNEFIENLYDVSIKF